jgi:hypothetical protein
MEANTGHPTPAVPGSPASNALPRPANEEGCSAGVRATRESFRTMKSSLPKQRDLLRKITVVAMQIATPTFGLLAMTLMIERRRLFEGAESR